LVTFYGAVALETKFTKFIIIFKDDNVFLGIILLIANIFMIFLVIHNAVLLSSQQQAIHSVQQEKAEHYEDGRQFGKLEFKNILNNFLLPNTHIRVYYYCTFEQAIDIPKVGFRAHVKFNGVPFTLRSPYETTLNGDFPVFGRNSDILDEINDYPKNKKNETDDETDDDYIFPNEHVFVISLPIHYLEPLLGYESDDGLCMISVKLLNALRPTLATLQNSNEILINKPWINENKVLLPQCIINSYLILEPKQTYQEIQTVEYSPLIHEDDEEEEEEGEEIEYEDDEEDHNAHEEIEEGKRNQKRKEKNNKSRNLYDDINHNYNPRRGGHLSYRNQIKSFHCSSSSVAVQEGTHDLFDYLTCIGQIRFHLSELGLVPVYHYTSYCFFNTKTGFIISK